MGHRFTRQVMLLLLASLRWIKPLRFRTKTDGKLRRLHIGPRQIRVAIFDMALAFALAVADFRTVHTAAIRGIITNSGKAGDMAGFQRDCLR